MNVQELVWSHWIGLLHSFRLIGKNLPKHSQFIFTAELTNLCAQIDIAFHPLPEVSTRVVTHV